MKRLLVLVCLWLISSGCSNSGVTPGIPGGIMPKTAADIAPNTWTWGYFNINISSDRTKIDVIPRRDALFHFNVNKFVENSPCSNCLTFGKPQLQGDGTIKLKVWLRHPFPGQPLYTGFDVRGIVVFTATDYMWTADYVVDQGQDKPALMTFPKLYYSDPKKGGASLINPDGYTFYLNPLLDYMLHPL